jgi:hypothetical protein
VERCIQSSCGNYYIEKPHFKSSWLEIVNGALLFYKISILAIRVFYGAHNLSIVYVVKDTSWVFLNPTFVIF